MCECVAIFRNLQGNIKAEDKDRVGELNSGSSSPLPHTPPQLHVHGASENNEIKYLSSEFDMEISRVICNFCYYILKRFSKGCELLV